MRAKDEMALSLEYFVGVVRKKEGGLRNAKVERLQPGRRYFELTARQSSPHHLLGISLLSLVPGAYKYS